MINYMFTDISVHINTLEIMVTFEGQVKNFNYKTQFTAVNYRLCNDLFVI